MKDILPELNGKDYIERLYENYDLHFCKPEEREQLIGFLRNYWREDHIFVLRPSLLDWQHYDKKNNRYNYVVAKDRKNGEFHSIMGFVPTYHFDDKIEKVAIWPCTWMANPNIPVKGLGTGLYHFVKTQLPVEAISLLGISESTLGIYEKWHFKMGKMQHFYILNETKNSFQLVKDNHNLSTLGYEEIDSAKQLEECDLQSFLTLPEGAFLGVNRYKSKEYFVNRFFKHPMYHYQAFVIKEKAQAQGVIITRVCEAMGSKCIRIVDMTCGVDKLCGMLKCFQELLRENDYEYIDFLEAGLEREMLLKAGFIDKVQSGAIVPNYFEPFCLKNVEIDFAFKSVDVDENPFFKADSDQDRPSRPID